MSVLVPSSTSSLRARCINIIMLTLILTLWVIHSTPPLDLKVAFLNLHLSRHTRVQLALSTTLSRCSLRLVKKGSITTRSLKWQSTSLMIELCHRLIWVSARTTKRAKQTYLMEGQMQPLQLNILISLTQVSCRSLNISCGRCETSTSMRWAWKWRDKMKEVPESTCNPTQIWGEDNRLLPTTGTKLSQTEVPRTTLRDSTSFMQRCERHLEETSSSSLTSSRTFHLSRLSLLGTLAWFTKMTVLAF